MLFNVYKKNICSYILLTIFLYFFKFHIYNIYSSLILISIITIFFSILLFNFLNFFSFFTIFLFMYYVFFISSIYVNSLSLIFDFKYIYICNFYKLYNDVLYNFLILELNQTNCLFSTTTVQITFFVNIFIFTYMYHDINFNKFFILINFFSSSMLLLLHSNNLLILFFSWELIGLTSFLLICFFFTKSIVIKSSLKALSFNRFSDVCFITFISIYYVVTNSFVLDDFNFIKFFTNSYLTTLFFFKINVIFIFIFFLVFSSFIKSAQFMFHFWLPDSMEAPAPASALIHSATLVASGIYLFNVFFLFFFFNNLILYLLLFIVSFTFFYGSFVSVYNSDIKKILAYSTISNCGLMFVAVLSSDIRSSIIFFILHGLFKSSSFIFIGYFIYLNKHKQDFKLFQGLNQFNLVFVSLSTITLLSLSSIFFFSNSFIKHIIIQNFFINIIIKIFLFLGSFFGSIYSVKLVYYMSTSVKSIYKYSNYKLNLSKHYVLISYMLYIYMSCISIHFISFKFNTIFLYNYIFIFMLLLCLLSIQNYISIASIMLILLILFMFINYFFTISFCNFSKCGFYLDFFLKKFIYKFYIKYNYSIYIYFLELYLVSFFMRNFFFNQLSFSLYKNFFILIFNLVLFLFNLYIFL